MIWYKIHEWLQRNQTLILLYVIDSKGSSPGRIGFKMIINELGELYGSIGGGVMEFKLIELCRNDLLGHDFKTFMKRQIHKDNIAKDKSGMICSGEQTIAFYKIGKQNSSMVSELLNSIESGNFGVLTATETGIKFDSDKSLIQKFEIEISGDEKWVMKEDIGISPELHIIGGGHVSLALSKLAHELGFSVTLYDDRKGLNTVVSNSYAKCVLVTDYTKIGDLVTSGADKYVVLMSFGYRTDKIILKQLLSRYASGKKFKYLGMMASKAKVDSLFKELMTEGISKVELDIVHAPIGLQIASKTPKEIAISILAEIIQVKNRS